MVITYDKRGKQEAYKQSPELMWQICEQPSSEPVHFILSTNINCNMCKLILLHAVWVTLKHPVCSTLRSYIFGHLCTNLYCAALLNNWHLWKKMAKVPRLYAKVPRLYAMIWALTN